MDTFCQIKLKLSFQHLHSLEIPIFFPIQCDLILLVIIPKKKLNVIRLTHCCSVKKLDLHWNEVKKIFWLIPSSDIIHSLIFKLIYFLFSRFYFFFFLLSHIMLKIWHDSNEARSGVAFESNSVPVCEKTDNPIKIDTVNLFHGPAGDVFLNIKSI